MLNLAPAGIDVIGESSGMLYIQRAGVNPDIFMSGAYLEGMNATTRMIIENLAAADATLSEQERQAVERLLKGGGALRPLFSGESLLMTQKEAARLLNVSRVTLWRLTRKGIFQPVEISPGTLRYRREEIESFARVGQQVPG